MECGGFSSIAGGGGERESEYLLEVSGAGAEEGDGVVVGGGGGHRGEEDAGEAEDGRRLHRHRAPQGRVHVHAAELVVDLQLLQNRGEHEGQRHLSRGTQQ